MLSATDVMPRGLSDSSQRSSQRIERYVDFVELQNVTQRTESSYEMPEPSSRKWIQLLLAPSSRFGQNFCNFCLKVMCALGLYSQNIIECQLPIRVWTYVYILLVSCGNIENEISTRLVEAQDSGFRSQASKV